jgi:hypothetical protein
MVTTKPEPLPSVPYSPRELPTALDFVNTIWERVFDHPLLRLRSVEKTAALSLDCATHDEFRARLEDLNELFRLIDIPDNLLPDSENPIPKVQTLARMETVLQVRLGKEPAFDGIRDAISDLRAMNTVRNKLTHGGSELADALNELGIEFPIRDHGRAWNRIRAKVAEALSTIRSALQREL